MATTLMKFKGGAELAKALQELPVKIERNIMRSALRAGAKVVLDEAKRNINDRSGDLSRSLRVSTRSRRGEVTATLKAGDREAYYAHMVEFGTAAHFISVSDEAKPSRLTRRGIKNYGIGTINKMVNAGSLVIGGNFVGASVSHPGAKPNPFMRPAIDEKQGEAIVAVGEQIRKRLTKQGLNTPDALEIDDE